MKGSGLAYFLLTAPKRWRLRFADRVRGTASGRALRAAYHACSPVWRNRLTSSLTSAIQRRLYQTDPRSYWQREGGRRYLEDEAYLLGSGSVSELQGRFLADEIRSLGATSVLEVGCGYGRLLREIRRNIKDGRVWGIDFSEPQLVAGRDYVAPSVIPLILADATQGLPLRDGSFDLVYTQGSLMHVPPPLDATFCRELARVSRRYIVHTEEFKNTVHTFALDVERHYDSLGYRRAKATPYPLNPTGQNLTFQVFEKRGAGSGF